ncbi:MAG: hypothetical protein RLZZ296_826, partial [Pseudomonadota bacterium]
MVISIKTRVLSEFNDRYASESLTSDRYNMI